MRRDSEIDAVAELRLDELFGKISTKAVQPKETTTESNQHDGPVARSPAGTSQQTCIDEAQESVMEGHKDEEKLRSTMANRARKAYHPINRSMSTDTTSNLGKRKSATK